MAFVPFDGATPSGKYERFADGFSGRTPLKEPGDATFRPTGLALGPDGTLYVADSVKGRIWRVLYRGDATDGAR